MYVTNSKHWSPVIRDLELNPGIRLDRNGDGRADVIFFDLKRTGRWDLSFWDENYTGNWTLVGYHDDGSLKPTRFESYAEFQKRMASR